MDAHNAELSNQRKHIGELIRGATIRLWNLQVDKKNRISDVRKFWTMPWDEPIEDDSEVKRLSSLGEDETQEEIDKFFSKVKRPDGFK